MEVDTKLDKIACDFINNTCEEGYCNFFNETYSLLQKIQLRLLDEDKENFERAIKVFAKYNLCVFD